MHKKQNQIILLVFLVLILITINYSYLDKAVENFLVKQEIVNVTRIIDGDTIVEGENTSVRLLGINSPERGEKYYIEAKEFLEKEILGKEVRLELGNEKYDKYKRVLGYVYFDNKNVNLELVREGFANYYFPSGKDLYYRDFEKAWEECIKKEINLCEKSIEKCGSCVKLKEFDYINEKIVLYNECEVECELTSWEIKDEGRKKFVFGKFILGAKNEVEIRVEEGTNNKTNLFWEDENYVWTDSGDTLFLRDNEGKLVLWESY